MIKLIEAALREKNISISDFAKQIGVSRQTIYEWQAGNYKPKTDKILAISKATGIPLDVLLEKVE